MDILTILKYTEAVVAIGIVISVVLQSRSGGLGAVFGGGGGEAYRSKRGIEALLYNATVVLGVIFTLVALAIAILSV
jgi:preprotein translocase subunit SecG